VLLAVTCWGASGTPWLHFSVAAPVLGGAVSCCGCWAAARLTAMHSCVARGAGWHCATGCVKGEAGWQILTPVLRAAFTHDCIVLYRDVRRLPVWNGSKTVTGRVAGWPWMVARQRHVRCASGSSLAWCFGKFYLGGGLVLLWTRWVGGWARLLGGVSMYDPCRAPAAGCTCTRWCCSRGPRAVMAAPVGRVHSL
jgi:hypothetical protein